jgi:hypothetical protein
MKDNSRRSFVKTSAATGLTFTFAGLIRAHGAPAGGTTSGQTTAPQTTVQTYTSTTQTTGGQVTKIKSKTYAITLQSQKHTGSAPTAEEYMQSQAYIDDKDTIEQAWPENHDPENDQRATLVDTDYIEVPNNYVVKSGFPSSMTSPAVDDITPQIVQDGNGWKAVFTFNSIKTWEYEAPTS